MLKNNSTSPLIVSVYILIFLSIIFQSCDTNQNSAIVQEEEGLNDELFISTMQKHLDAVTNRDLSTLESTLSPDGKMQLILPGSEIMNTSKAFMDYHREWFEDTTWAFETKILNTEIGENMGIAITEIIYREPERNGKPYFNRMAVSYALKKDNGNWYIIKDHASSIEKSQQ